jgi:uncharacterized protein
MKIAVISDSHGHTDLVARLTDRLTRAGIDTAIHLGDDYDDASPLLTAGFEVLRVPGVYSEYYQNPDIPNRLAVELGGLKILLTHSDRPHENDRPEDGDPSRVAEQARPDLVLFGHSHLPTLEDRQGRLWMNPGHLKPEDKKGAPPSYAVIDTDKAPFRVTIYNFLDDTILMER